MHFMIITVRNTGSNEKWTQEQWEHYELDPYREQWLRDRQIDAMILASMPEATEEELQEQRELGYLIEWNEQTKRWE
jgi:hypothetical protein